MRIFENPCKSLAHQSFCCVFLHALEVHKRTFLHTVRPEVPMSMGLFREALVVKWHRARSARGRPCDQSPSCPSASGLGRSQNSRGPSLAAQRRSRRCPSETNENHGRTRRKPEEHYRKTTGEPQENRRETMGKTTRKHQGKVGKPKADRRKKLGKL